MNLSQIMALADAPDAIKDQAFSLLASWTAQSNASRQLEGILKDIASEAATLESLNYAGHGCQRTREQVRARMSILETKKVELEAQLQPLQKTSAPKQHQTLVHERRVPTILSESQQKRNLEKRLREAIAPYKNGYTMPPFSFPELLVIAVVLNKWRKSKKGIHHWILQNFGYYRELALINQSNLGKHNDPNRKLAMRLSEDINEAFMDFEAPLFRQQQEDIHADDKLLYPESSIDAGRWVVQSPAAAKHFLRRHLVTAPARSRACRFMALPTELRLRIYEYALLFPKSGVQIQDRYTRPKTLLAFSKDYDKAATRVLASGQMSRGVRSQDYCLPRRLNGPLISSHLALFSVNKEIYQEAMPVFFGDNLFVCKSTRDLHDLLFGTTEERRNHIRYIAFSIIHDCKHYAAKTFKLLATLPRLRHLDIWINEDSFKTDKKGLAGLPGFVLPGFPALRSMRGLEAVRFHGECDTIKNVLEAEMTKPKKEKKTAVAGKRKAVSSGGNKVKSQKLA